MAIRILAPNSSPSSTMLPFQIKICGVSSSADAVAACQLGADAIGLNFYERSSRFVDGETAAEIARAIDQFNREQLPASKVKKIGVFVDMPVPEIVAIAWHIGLDGIQLHGQERPSIVSEIRSQLERTGLECLLIRAVRCAASHSTPSTPDSQPEVVDREIEDWINQPVDLILLDAAVAGEFGGTGTAINLDQIAHLDRDLPIVLAGGLDPTNVARAIRESGFQSVDVASGVESAPGTKDHERIKAFIDAAKSELR